MLCYKQRIVYRRCGNLRDYLKELRESKGLSQQNVADSIGITRQYYQQIENGEHGRFIGCPAF